MKRSKKLFIALYAVISAHIASAQIFSEGLPICSPETDTVFVPQVIIEAENTYFKGGAKSLPFKDNQFAVPVDVEINPKKYGKWVEYPLLNKKVWLLAIKVEEASGINLILEPFQLKEGAKLFFYNEDKSRVLGAITSKNNKKSGILPIAEIKGDFVYCEMQLPLYQENYGDFTIAKIGAEKSRRKGPLKSTDDEWFGWSASCHVNVNCYDSFNIRRQRKAVCRIIYLGSRRCTGTLINNLNNDGTPYIITAGHCVNTEEVANSSIFYFNYLSPDCENVDVEPSSVSGASLVAAGFHVRGGYDTLDFALLRLSKTPPLDYGVYYTGWNATNDEVESGYVLHHPQGDIMKISINEDPVETESFESYFDKNTHWLVRDYEVGTSGEGSSGAGLLDHESRLIGTLTGGDDTCSSRINDFYQKLYHSYNDYKDDRYRLKPWLDPENTGKLICDGYDPSFSYREQAGVIANFKPEGTPEVLLQEKGYGFLAGHNYQENKQFSEHYEINGSKYLVGAGLNLAAVRSTAVNQYVSFLVWEGGDTPGEVIYEKKVLISDYEDLIARSKDSVQYIEFDSTVLVHYNFHFGFKISYPDGTFALKTVPADGEDNVALTLVNGKWEPLKLDGKDEYVNLAVEIYAFDFKAEKGELPDTSSWGDVQVYPNPVHGRMQVSFKNTPPQRFEFRLYNLWGQPVFIKEFEKPGKNMPVDIDIEAGLYILHITTEEKTIRKTKVLVL